jgi:hypothetical protein
VGLGIGTGGGMNDARETFPGLRIFVYPFKRTYNKRFGTTGRVVEGIKGVEDIIRS